MLEGVVRRLVRRPAPPKNVEMGVSLVGRGSIALKASVGFPALPEGDVPAAIADLDERTRRLVNRIAQAEEKLEAAVDRAQHQTSMLAARIDSEIARLDQQGRRVAIGDARLAASGLFLVLLGLLVQGVAGLVR